MMRRRVVAIACSMLVFTAALVPSVALGRMSAATAGPARTASCSISDLRLTTGSLISAKTEQTPVVFVLYNQSATTCTLDGYPRFAMYSRRGKLLPFSYRTGSDLELAAPRPREVRLSRGHAAYFAINAKACVLHTTARVGRVVVNPPNMAATLTTNLQRGLFIGYCAAKDPAGHRIDVTPIEAEISKLFAS
jgi:Protein of unknown function (DUF4232)